jgi:hypothetical protein
LMQPLYRFNDAQAAPWLWMHHHCADICSNTQFQAAMTRFETQVHSMADSQAGGSVVDITKARARVNLAAAADRAARSLQALRRAKATLEIANIGPDDAPHKQTARKQESAEDEASRVSACRNGSDESGASTRPDRAMMNRWRKHLRWIKHCYPGGSLKHAGGPDVLWLARSESKSG